MINFRYHIVSITAVFLALAIGTALGSTFLDGPTVDLLNRNIRNAEDRIEATNAENGRLSGLNDAAQEREESLLIDGGPQVFASMLTDVPVLVLVAPGVDPGESTDLVGSLANSGADLRGVVDLKDELLFADGTDEDLALSLGVDPDDEVSILRETVNERLLNALTAAGAEAPPEPEAEVEGDLGPAVEPGSDADGQGEAEAEPAPGPDDTITDEAGAEEAGNGDQEEAAEGEPALDGTQPEIITILEESGHISIDRLGGDGEPVLEVPGYRFVLITGHETDDRQRQAGLGLLSNDEQNAPLPLVVVSASLPSDGEDELTSLSLVQAVRDDDELQGQYSTVDNIESFSGVTAMMLLLNDIGSAIPGHYGQGPGAQAVLPAAT